MRFNRYWLYPRVRNFKRILPVVVSGALIGGVYGAVHDQVSYTISPEYFTRFKFYQFQYADLGLPPRGFVSVIGFLATWWMGAFVGWILARIRFNSDDLLSARRDILYGVVTVLCIVLLSAALGAFVGYLRAYHFPLRTFLGWESELTAPALRRFVVVGFLHNAEYLGGFIGLVIAIVRMKRRYAVKSAKIRH